MKYAIISDIHANPAALERVLADATRYGVDQVVCAGDIVGYGPYPAETIRIVRERNIPTVMGNHDAAVAGWRDTDNMIGSAKEGTARHRRELGEGDISWLRSLPYVYEAADFAVAHANFRTPEFMLYIGDRLEARDSIFCRDESILFVGHTHVEALYRVGFVSDPHFPDSEQLEPHDFKMEDRWRYLVNAGAVGYPRVKDYSSYVIFDSATNEVQFRRVEFDFAGYVAALRKKSIPIPPWMKEDSSSIAG